MPAAPDGPGGEPDSGPTETDGNGNADADADADSEDPVERAVDDRDDRDDRRPLSEAAFAAALAGLDALDLARFVAALRRARGDEATVEATPDGRGAVDERAEESVGRPAGVRGPVHVRVRSADGVRRTLLVRSPRSGVAFGLGTDPRTLLRRLHARVERSTARSTDRGADGTWADVDAVVSVDGTRSGSLPSDVDVVDAADLYREATYGVDRGTFDALVREHLDRPGLVARPTTTEGRDDESGGDGREATPRSRPVAAGVLGFVLVALLVVGLVAAGAVPAGFGAQVADGGGEGGDGGDEAPGASSATRTTMGWNVADITATMTPTTESAGTATPDAVPPTRPATPVPVVAGCPVPPRDAHPSDLRPGVVEAASAHGLQGWRLVEAENVSRYDGLNSQETPFEPIVRHVAGYVDPGGRSYRLYLDLWASPGQADEVAREMVGFRHAWLAWGRYTVAVDVYGVEGERLSGVAAVEPTRRVLAAVRAPREEPGNATGTATGTLGRACVARLLARTNETERESGDLAVTPTHPVNAVVPAASGTGPTGGTPPVDADGSASGDGGVARRLGGGATERRLGATAVRSGTKD